MCKAEGTNIVFSCSLDVNMHACAICTSAHVDMVGGSIGSTEKDDILVSWGSDIIIRRGHQDRLLALQAAKRSRELREKV